MEKVCQLVDEVWNSEVGLARADGLDYGAFMEGGEVKT